MDCQHIFVTKEKKEHPSCVGTHYTECLHCAKHYSQHHTDVMTCEVQENAERIKRTLPELSNDEKFQFTRRYMDINIKMAESICVYDGDLYPNEKKCVNVNSNHKCS